jgi:hypothetical protein
MTTAEYLVLIVALGFIVAALGIRLLIHAVRLARAERR